jgi:glycosyltransferase involved in cell wall biosynthesis
MADPVWFWLDIVSPHMAGLAAALAARGRSVTYVAERSLSPRRLAGGWNEPALGKAILRLAPDARSTMRLVDEAPQESVHICMGLRGNGLVGVAQKALARRGLRQWVIMEAVDNNGLRGALRRLEYRRLVHRRRADVEGMLAIGDTTPNWLVARGMPRERVFPFAYFLPDRMQEVPPSFEADAPFRFLYVGQLIERKRIDLLLDALARSAGEAFELLVIGFGPLEPVLRVAADRKLPGRVRWLGRRNIGEIPALMSEADCLVLPSRHDGWGAVVSEALMAGTPTICSDACGAAVVVRVSGRGSVFPAGDVTALAQVLSNAIMQGKQTPDRRLALAEWAECLGACAGAKYLNALLGCMERQREITPPPWEPEI